MAALGFFEASRRSAERLVLPLDRLFNRIFLARYNPLYRSGTIAMGLMAIALATGLYLVFFYRLGQPYESVLALQEQPWLGRWMRSTHRYSSDAAVVATLIHILRMAIQGKTWGPRTLAWISGVILLISLFVSGWTGFAMVWDLQAQAMVSAGALIFDSLGFLAEPVGRSFNGSIAQPPASFFFLNLFLHIIVPLAMIFGVWVHTSRMANAVWLPHRRLLIGLVVATVFVSVVWPAPLPAKADLLKLPGILPLDLFYNFWLPLAERSPRLVFGLWAGAMLVLSSVPFWYRPREALRPQVSTNDPAACQGCGQCVKDCPYEAIRMVPREGSSRELAVVDPSLCVSCGLCAASCTAFTIGPPGRKASDQFAAVRAHLSGIGAQDAAERQVVIMACSNQPSTLERIRRFAGSEAGFQVYPVECAGSIHASVVESLSKSFGAVAIAACPERNCTNKDANRLLQERIGGVRPPFPSRRLDRSKLRVFEAAVGCESSLFEKLRALRDGKESTEEGLDSAGARLRAAAAGIAVLVAVAGLSRFPQGAAASQGILRLSWRLPGQAIKFCRERSAEELKALPAHMRLPEACTRQQLNYRLSVEVDGKAVIDETVRPGGLQHDRPLYVDRELGFAAGRHSVHVRFEPEAGAGAPATDAHRYDFRQDVEIRSGEVSLVHLGADLRELSLAKGARE